MTDTVKDVIGLYLKLRQRKEQIENKMKTRLAAIREDMSTLEGWLLQQAETDGVKSFRTDEGTAYVTTQDSATVADWDATLAHIVEHESYELLEKRVSKVAVRNYIDETGAPPPGVNFSSRLSVNVRSPAPE